MNKSMELDGKNLKCGKKEENEQGCGDEAFWIAVQAVDVIH